MNLILYRNNSLTNVVNKNITLITNHSNIKFIDPYNEYMPVVRVKGKTNWDDVNYFAISSSGTNNDSFTRYYFLEDVTIKSPQIAILRGRLDVLKTYQTFIGSLKCYLLRSDSHGDDYLMDTKPSKVYSDISKLTFKNSMGDTVGFVPPGQSTEAQKSYGVFVMTTLQDDYKQKSME